MPQLEFQIVPADVRQFVKYSALRSPLSRKSLLRSRVLLLISFLTLAVITAARHGGGAKGTIFVLTVAAVTFPIAWLVPYAVRLASAGALWRRQIHEGRILGQWAITVDDAGLHHRHVNGSGSIPWAAVSNLAENGSALYVFTNPHTAYVIPGSAFKGIDRQAIVSYVATRVSSGRHEEQAGRPSETLG